MRLAIAASTVRQAGGVEAYVGQVSSALAARGHDVSLWHETDEPLSRPRLDLDGSVHVAAFDTDASRARDQLREWRPDVVLLNELENPIREASLSGTFRSVLIAHNYHGICVSGTKTWNRPHVQPCTRPFGAGCLLAYFPRQCGGRNPMTMLSLYSVASKRLEAASRCAAIVTLSDHMRREFLRQGMPSERVLTVPYGPTGAAGHDAPPARAAGDTPHLVVVSRLERVKGVHVAIDAAADLVDRLNRPIMLTIIGDGREKERLAQQARDRCRHVARLSVEFTGWLAPDARDRILSDQDLLLLPSIWSEPYGLVGLEAGRFGLPAVAFDLGGIRQWLDDGVNGRLAAADPPTVEGLAQAAADCLRDGAGYTAMRTAAHRLTSRNTLETHVDGLLALFSSLLTSHPMVPTCASA